MVEITVLEKARKILEIPVCDNCLGRQFAKLLSGYTNRERGMLLRTIAAMSIDREKLEHADNKIDMSNFSGYRFNSLEPGSIPAAKCSVCSGLFSIIGKFADNTAKKTKNYELSTFIIGTKISSELNEQEEKLWEHAGIDFCETIKAELNREIGKLVEKKTGMKFDSKKPDASFLVSVPSGAVGIQVNPLFIYGEYQKLVRGIPQTRWPSGKYKTSVEQIIAKPFMSASGGKSHKFHGSGREDIDALCLAWRPFVLEIAEPRRRFFDPKACAKKIGKKVRVRNARFSGISEVRELKDARHDKTYRTLVACKEPLKKSDLAALRCLEGVVIRQRTPSRVLHRRADRTRKRMVNEIKIRYSGRNAFRLVVRGDAGLYIKELISGDSGRTQPSVSSVLGKHCECREIDVIKIHKNRS